MTFDSHIVQVCRAANFQIRALRHVRNVIPNDTAKSVAQTLWALAWIMQIRSYSEYRSKILQNFREHSCSSGDALQSLYDSDTIQFQKLHWLPIKQRIDF